MPPPGLPPTDHRPLHPGEPDRPARRSPLAIFLGRPTLGGWLTILNCLGCAAIQLYARSTEPHGPQGIAMGVFVVCAIALSFPLVMCMLLPQVHFGSQLADVIGTSVLMGLNALVWGYGLAWFLRWPKNPHPDPDPDPEPDTPPERLPPPAADAPAPRR